MSDAHDGHAADDEATRGLRARDAERAKNETDVEKPHPASDVHQATDALIPHLRAVRLGHGANCSSIGSAVDLLFATSAIGAALLAAVAASLARETAPNDRVVDSDENARDRSITHETDGAREPNENR